MFEITPEDIALLNDKDLRALVGQLCEAEIRKHGLSAATVTWGGHQNAGDGGVDVRVDLPLDTKIEGFIPRPVTCFQVKKEDMPSNKIVAEMRPSGSLRPSIQELAAHNGAYIIVSSKGSTSDIPLANRRAAMAEASKDCANAQSLLLDFYDRTRLATWVRDHSGLILWVKEKIGKALAGWRPYGAWAYEPEGESGKYLLDDTVRIFAGEEERETGRTAIMGIQQIRDLLRHPRRVVRLVGLSGVGKTRFVQALFDERIGEHSLEPSLAVYTNMTDGPEPQPIGLASDLLALRKRAILIIDNCAPDLHRGLSELCRISESTLSIITVEYDIRDDAPEGTDVFKLQPASDDLIENLIRRRFCEVSPVDARTVAKFSDGNARIAITLAATVKNRETLAGLSDEDLFRRLFEQRHSPDQSLLRAAQACSLVYSFHGEDVSDEAEAELVRLGCLIGKTAHELFTSIAELIRRDLVQQRSVWRAVLPHAIANRLATRALQEIPLPLLENQLAHGNGRLLKSFSRRLSFLHRSKEAKTIAKKWLAAGGFLADITSLNDLGLTIFNDIAPIEPEATLEVLETALLGSGSEASLRQGKEFVHTLRSLAYDPALFERSMALILKMAESGDVNQNNNNGNEPLKVFISMFQIYFSGTHATIEQRLQVIEAMILSENDKHRSIGLEALKAILKTSFFDSFYSFEFGARSRDYGYRPHDQQEVKQWYASTIKLAERLALSGSQCAPAVRALLAENFLGLWSKAAIYEELENLCRSISAKYFWPEGWIAVRRTRQAGIEAPEAPRLEYLETLLKPENLIQRVRAIVLTTKRNGAYYDYFEDDATNDLMASMQRTETLSQELGSAVAKDENVFREILPDLVRGDGRLWSFGQGLAAGAKNPNVIWEQLVAEIAAFEGTTPNIHTLCGFLSGLHAKNPIAANIFLDDTLQNVHLAGWYPRLQTAVPIDKLGIDRLRLSLTLNNISVTTYRHLAWGGAVTPIPARQLKELVLTIAAKPGGADVALEITHMRLHSTNDEEKNHDPELIEAGRELMSQLDFAKSTTHEDYTLGEVAKACLNGKEGMPIVEDICHKLLSSVLKHEIHVFNHSHFLESLFIVQPLAALNGFLGDSSGREAGTRIIDDARDMKGNPLDKVPEQELLAWCDKEPFTRYPIIASLITISQSAGKPGQQRWTTIALEILKKAPDRIEVLKKFISQMTLLSGWTGSLAATIESNIQILNNLAEYPDCVVVDFISREKVRIQKLIERERRSEDSYGRITNERFE